MRANLPQHRRLRNRPGTFNTAGGETRMDFAIPAALEEYYAELEAFIEAEIEPLVAEGDNVRFFDHRREHARTDWDAGGAAAARLGRAFARGPSARRCGGPLALLCPQAIRRQGRVGTYGWR